jgi:hypothetical protein
MQNARVIVDGDARALRGGDRPLPPRWQMRVPDVVARTRCLAVALCLAGCTAMAARTSSDYDKGSATDRRYQQDAEGCEKQAEANQKDHGMGPYDPTHGSYNWMYDVCMRSGGYERRKAQ